MTEAGHKPPFDQQAEESVLGSVLLNNDALANVLPILRPEHFYVRSNRVVYQAMVDLGGQGKSLDAVTIGTHLKAKGELKKIGGAVALNNLTDQIVTSVRAGEYARIVRDLHAQRSVIYAAQEIIAKGYSGVSNTEEYLTESQKAIALAASSATYGGGPRQIDADIKEIFGDLETGREPEGIVKTGIPIIDHITGGLWPGLLTVVAGRPSMGKSCFVLNVAANVALSGKKVLYFTLEDVRKYTVRRLLSRFANIDLTDLTLRKITDTQWPNLIQAANNLSGNKPLWIEDASALSSSAIHQIAAAHKMLHGLDLLIIDHLGEVSERGDQTERASKAAATCRDIAKALGIPVLLASQLNREVEKRPNKRPQLADLKQSGRIEEVARSVWFLYRPGYYDGDEKSRQLELIVAKANHGKTGTLKHWIDLSRMYVRAWDLNKDGPFYPNTNSSAQPAAASTRGPNTQQHFGGRFEY